MQLRHVGELNLLKEIRKRFSSAPQTEDSGIIIGIGDDAAVIAPRKEKLLVTTDMMNEGVHFDLGFTAPFPLGFKLVSVNVSDIMAMGGRPAYLFLNIALKNDADEDFFWGLYEGISAALDAYKVKLLGGDLSSALHDMVLSATVIGVGDKVITRGGASAGDKIYVTSTVGDSACGLEILKRLTPESRNMVQSSKFKVQSEGKEKKLLSLSQGASTVFLDRHIAGPLLRRHLMPVARDSGRVSPYATSMIDVSDGLFIDLCRLCDESKTGARVYLDRIPVSNEMRQAAELLGLDPLYLATSGGEDYELLFTAPPDINISDELSVMSNELKEKDTSRITDYASLPLKVTCIGEITTESRTVVDKTGRESILRSEGYQHFGAP